MATQTIAWTTLPRGFNSAAGGAARISVFVSPRLTPDGEGTLAAFDFLNWAALFTSGSIDFEVAFGDETVTATIVSTPQPALWSALFNAQTLVRPHAFDTTSKVVGTYPAARMHDLVQTAYQHVSAEPPGPGRVRSALNATFDGLQELFAPAAPAPADLHAVTEAGRAAQAASVFGQPTPEALTAHLNLLVDMAMRDAATRTTETVDIVPDRRDSASALTQFMVFHKQPRGTAPASGVVAINQLDARDFHQRLTMLSEYPELLRALGLIVDLHVDPADIPPTTAANPGLVRVIPHLSSTLGVLQHLPDVTPFTAYIFEPGRTFSAAPRPSDADTNISGLMNLHLDGQYRVMQVDVDGAGLKLIDLLRKTMADNAEDRDILTLPALRSTGVTIAREGQAGALVSAMTTSGTTMSAVVENTVLFENDLIRGFRVDVGDPESGVWHSLHRRDATYRFGGAAQTLAVSDEGWSQETVVQPTAAPAGSVPTSLDPAVPNFVSEYLFNWQGWSLTAPRPGATMPEPAGTPPTDEAQGLGMTVDVVPAKGSLPRLRFGRGYRLRLRTVDLAGNGLTLKEADDVTAELGAAAPVLPHPDTDDNFRFLRFEPVPPPTAVPRVQLVPQSTDVRRVPGVDRIVLRSDFNHTPEELEQQHPDYAPDAERHFVPPATYQQLVEMHGLLDASIGTGTNHDSTHRVASREENTLPKVHAGEDLPVDYLPDPLVAGASFWSLPGMPQGKIGRLAGDQIQLSDLAVSGDLLGEHRSVLLIDFGTSWPDSSSFRLRLAEGDGMPTWNPADRILTVFLPKGDTRTVQVSSYLPDDAALEMLGLWQWTRQRLRDQAALGEISEETRLTRELQLKQLAMLGLSPMQTPSREITLVHAVQRPTGPEPALSFTPVRVGSRTFAYTRGDVQVPRASTGTVELVASWSERIDTWTDGALTADPANPPPEPAPVTRRVPVFAGPFPLAEGTESTASTTKVPAQTFDPDAGIVRYPGPALEELMSAVERSLNGFEGALRRLAVAAKPDETFVDDFVNSARSRLSHAATFPPGPDYWTELSRVADEIGRHAQSESDGISVEVFLGEPPQPVHLKQPYQDVATEGEALKTRASLSAAELRSFLGRHEFGDTKYRRLTYQAVLTSRFGEDFTAAGQTGADFTRVSNGVNVDIPSSTRPLAPEVVAIVPSFAWDRTSQADTRSSQRRGALRIYLARPWYTSGDGEMLGVIVLSDPSNFPPFSNPITQDITLLGRDPLWTSPRPPIMGAPANFPNAATKVSLTDPPNDPFALALLGFDVAFDKAGRCFCDVEVVSPSYFQFVRLALVRYQPHSLPGLTMSPIVIADFAQAAPQRNISVLNNAANTLAISVSGATHDGPETFGRVGNRFQVTVQRRIAGTSDDAGWLADTEAGFVVAADATAPQPPVLWGGTVTRPPTPVAGEYRLLIEEFEPFTAFRGGPTPTERVVFVETVALVHRLEPAETRIDVTPRLEIHGPTPF